MCTFGMACALQTEPRAKEKPSLAWTCEHVGTLRRALVRNSLNTSPIRIETRATARQHLAPPVLDQGHKGVLVQRRGHDSMSLKPKMEPQKDHTRNVKVITGNDYGAVLVDVSTMQQ